jgi:23S rRNA-/tRNA-specific pseudouridylate synthase/cold shock CspA family protein
MLSSALVARLLVLQPPQQCRWAVSMNAKASPLVLHEGDGWLVVNKPRGMIVHDGPESLIDALASAGYKGTSPVHRLDAETSGVMLFSQNPRGGKSDIKGLLTACLADPLTVKQYVGVVKGDLVGSGTWDQTISPKAEGRKNPRGVSAVRVSAETDYVALGLHSHLSVASFVLRTGRTHQIRKHAACNGFPIVGDARYGDPKHDEKVCERCAFEGMALHASRLHITIEGTTHDFVAPVPSEWNGLLSQFGSLALPAVGDALPQPAPRSAKARGSAGAKPGGLRQSGEVATWNRVKGYGFIKREGKGLDNIYVHQRSIKGVAGFRSLLEGESVQFDVGTMADGKLEALHVTGPGGRPVIGLPPRTEEEREPRDPQLSAGRGQPKAEKVKVAYGSLPPGAYAPKNKKVA